MYRQYLRLEFTADVSRVTGSTAAADSCSSSCAISLAFSRALCCKLVRSTCALVNIPRFPNERPQMKTMSLPYSMELCCSHTYQIGRASCRERVCQYV